jgi:hypothetical protein
MVAHYIPQPHKMLPSQHPASPSQLRWSRMLVRLLLRKRWHYQGLLVWLIQRPFLRFLPTLLPMVSTAVDMVKRRTWPKLWLSRVQHLFTVVHLNAITLRSRMGLLESFMEDEAVTFRLQAVKTRSRARQQAALVEETHRAVAALDGHREELARRLIGPRGLPRKRPTW